MPDPAIGSLTPLPQLKVALYNSPLVVNRWRDELLAAMPGLDLRIWPEIGDPAEIDAVLCWIPPAEMFAGMRRLKLIQYLGAGIDGLLRSGITLPDVPVARMVDPVMGRRMAEYVLFGTMRAHRQFDQYARQQRAGEWARALHPDPADIKVGILGMGEIGMVTANTLRHFGYDVEGWARSPKPDAGFKVHTGEAGMPAFLARSQILACLLPLTPATTGILNSTTFNAMPKGATVINLARGQHVVVPDLLAALDSGQLGGAVLDVFDEEPLPASSPLWQHPKVMLTPHIAGFTNPKTASQRIARQLRKLAAGQPLQDLVDFNRGY